MEELVAFEINKFIGFGSAGSLVENINIGDVVVCPKAFPNEGTSPARVRLAALNSPSDFGVSSVERSVER